MRRVVCFRQRAAVVAAVLCVAFTCVREGRTENENWKELNQRFRDAWKIGGVDNPSVRSTLRGKKRTAAMALGDARDGRAVPVLMSAHKEQLKFIEKLHSAWVKRKAAHDKLAPAMERALRAKPTNPGGGIMVTPAEQAWIQEKTAIEALYADILEEEEIAEILREAMGFVLSETEGAEHDTALRAIFKAAGRGGSPEEREFIRLLGYVKGDDVTEALRTFARDTQPLVAQAALEALGRQNAPGSSLFLLARLEDARWQIRASVLLGLSFIREARVVDALLKHADAESGVLRRHVLTALARLVGAEAEALPTTIPAWRTWWGKNRVRVETAWRENRRLGPIREDLSPVELGGGEGSTSFYGIQTDSKHIIFVIDVSGSMGEHGGVNDQGEMRIDVVKRELKGAIRSLSASVSDERGPSSFNIVAYAEDVRVFKGGKMIPATKSNKDKAFAWIDDLEAIGATNIFDAVEKGFHIVDTRRLDKQLDQGADTIFLMTDGMPNRGRVVEPDLICQEVKKMNRDRRITIHTIGVGPDHNRGFLKQLASESSGQYLAR